MKIWVVHVRSREWYREEEGADGDMLIYELQGFSLTILGFTETERGRERESKTEKGKVRLIDSGMQNWGDSGRESEGEEHGRRSFAE